ncbi:type II and III secretion system protein [soil metagenome]
MNCSISKITLRVLAAVLLSTAPLGLVAEAHAQQLTPPYRTVRAYVPQDQLVSFMPQTPMNQFVRLLNPIFQRVTGKLIVDPDDRLTAINVSITGMHFIDAFEVVLDRNGLDFRESENYFIITDRRRDVPDSVELVGTDGRSTRVESTAPASARSRQVRIDAIIFELNATRARETGTNWGVIFGEATGGAGGGTGGGTGGTATSTGDVPQLYLSTGSFFDRLGDLIQGPDRVDFAVLMRLFRLLESRGIGETIASPNINVQSGETGRFQSGSDIPVQTQDFQGNTITQLIPTGVILNITPTLISDNSDEPGGEPVDFIHLDVTVERSAGRLSASGPIVDKTTASTQVLMHDGEMDVIGGIFSQEESVFRRGIPVLKDIPLLRYLFSYSTRSTTQKELIIVLQTRVSEPMRQRAARQDVPRNIYREEREDLRNRLDRFRPGMGGQYEMINPEEREAVRPGDIQE